MVGISGQSSNLTDARNDANIPIWQQAGSDPIDLPSGIEYIEGKNLNGAEVSFLRRLHSRGVHRAIGVKYAANGKSLSNYFKPSASGYPKIINAVEEATRKYHPFRIRWRSVVWVQGQQDSSTQVQADAYEQNLTDLMAAIRSDLSTPDLYFCSPLHPPSWSTKDYDATVRAAVASFVASDSYALSVDAEDAATRDEGIHYEQDSFEILGNRMAEAYLEQRSLG